MKDTPVLKYKHLETLIYTCDVLKVIIDNHIIANKKNHKDVLKLKSVFVLNIIYFSIVNNTTSNGRLNNSNAKLG